MLHNLVVLVAAPRGGKRTHSAIVCLSCFQRLDLVPQGLFGAGAGCRAGTPLPTGRLVSRIVRSRDRYCAIAGDAMRIIALAIWALCFTQLSAQSP
jgi:hypothetical protein